jgi:hypothetical protein
MRHDSIYYQDLHQPIWRGGVNLWLQGDLIDPLQSCLYNRNGEVILRITFISQLPRAYGYTETFYADVLIPEVIAAYRLELGKAVLEYEHKACRQAAVKAAISLLNQTGAQLTVCGGREFTDNRRSRSKHSSNFHLVLDPLGGQEPIGLLSHFEDNVTMEHCFAEEQELQFFNRSVGRLYLTDPLHDGLIRESPLNYWPGQPCATYYVTHQVTLVMPETSDAEFGSMAQAMCRNQPIRSAR